MNQLTANKETSIAKTSDLHASALRTITEVESAIIIAKRFPRDEDQAMIKIVKACTSMKMAEKALFSYPRGNEDVIGPTIRLAELLAQKWGNMQTGFRILSVANNVSSVEAFAWDVENNSRKAIEFDVEHIRQTKTTSYALTTSRDIYEMVANQAARRIRVCILALIPGDILEAATDQVNFTINQEMGAPKEQIEALVEAFIEYEVSAMQIARLLKKNINACTNHDVLHLKRIYQALKNGKATALDYFQQDTIDVTNDKSKITEGIEKARQNQKANTAHEKSKQEPELKGSKNPDQTGSKKK